jgi:hypothetical protein
MSRTTGLSIHGPAEMQIFTRSVAAFAATWDLELTHTLTKFHVLE